MTTRETLTWLFVGAGIFGLLIMLGGALHERSRRKKTTKARDIEAGAHRTAGGKYRRDMYNKTRKSRVLLSKSKIGRPQQPATGGVQIPPYAVVRGNNVHIPERSPQGPQIRAPSPPRMAPSPPRPARPPHVQVAARNYDYNIPMGPISPMTAGDWKRSHGRRSAISLK